MTCPRRSSANANLTADDKALVERHQGQWEEAQRITNEFWTFTLGLCLDPACRYLLVSGSSTSVVASAFGATKVTT